MEHIATDESVEINSMETDVVDSNSKDELLSKLTTYAPKIIKEWAKTHDCNFSSVILAAMMIVERYSDEISSLPSKDKFDLAQALIPIIIDFVVGLGKMSEHDGKKLKKRLAKYTDIVEQAIETYIEISQNPAVIQVVTEVKEQTKGCFSFLRRKFSKSKK